MDEFEIELDDELVPYIQQLADREGRSFEEQACLMIREGLESILSKATSHEPTAPSGGDPTGP